MRRSPWQQGCGERLHFKRISFLTLRLDRLTFGTPRRPYERERLDQELRICGEYGLRNKREIWRVQLVLAKIRKVVLRRSELIVGCS